MLSNSKQEIIQLYTSKNEEDKLAWINTHSEEDKIEIMKIMVEYIESLPDIKNDKSIMERTTDLKIDIGLIENAIIDEQVQEMMDEIEFQAKMKEADEAYQKLRTTLIEHLLQNPTDEGSIDVAKQLIEIEIKNEGYYDENNWKKILHLTKKK